MSRDSANENNDRNNKIDKANSKSWFILDNFELSLTESSLSNKKQLTLAKDP